VLAVAPIDLDQEEHFMKTFIALALVLAVAQTALAQSRGGSAGWIGSLKSGKATVASGKDLERAQRYAQQAQKRLGGTSRSGSGGWAAGGSGWQSGGSANRR